MQRANTTEDNTRKHTRQDKTSLMKKYLRWQENRWQRVVRKILVNLPTFVVSKATQSQDKISQGKTTTRQDKTITRQDKATKR
jgi:hypothetical protein